MATVRKVNNGLAAWQAVIASLAFIMASGILAQWFSDRVASTILVMFGALQAGTAVYVAMVKPVEAVDTPTKTGV
jgi:hypothetical protein